jgi:hypothetical protein
LERALAEVFGATLINLDVPFHGVSTPLKILDKNNRLYKELDDKEFDHVILGTSICEAILSANLSKNVNNEVWSLHCRSEFNCPRCCFFCVALSTFKNWCNAIARWGGLAG